MSVIYSLTTKNARMQLVADLIASGRLVIGTSSLSGTTGVLVNGVLSATAASISGGILTLLGVPIATTATGAGVAALAELRNSAGAAIVTGLTVNTAGADIIIGNTNVTIGETVSINSGTITHG